MSENALYADLSAYYDLMCADIDYREQCESAKRIHQLFGQGGKNYLDLACGTGPHISAFLEYGYCATGLDLNIAMLNLARKRCPQATFSQQNMNDFHFDTKFDLITCFLYSLHYCSPKTSFTQALSQAYDALNPGGVLCYRTKDGTLETFDFQSRWCYQGLGETLDLHVSIVRTVNDVSEQWSDTHIMTAVSITEIRAVLESIGFEVHFFERDFSRLVEATENSGNILAVCVKPELRQS
jgi:ubiquinone/menaquinone biosynthesis C-methylase UbiE